MKLPAFSSLLPIVAFGVLLSTQPLLQAASLVAVDLGPGTAQAGFIAFSSGGDGPGPVSKTFTISDPVFVPGGTLTATLGGGSNANDLSQDVGNLNGRLRLSPTNSGAFTNADLLNDRVVSIATAAPGVGLFLQLTGLSPNTTFTIQVWGYDNGKAGNAAVYDRTNGANTVLGSYTVTTGQLPVDNNSFSVTGTVTSDSTGKIVVQSQSNIDGSGIMNGFVLSTVPEPATASLLALSGAVLLGRRRRSVQS